MTKKLVKVAATANPTPGSAPDLAPADDVSQQLHGPVLSPEAQQALRSLACALGSASARGAQVQNDQQVLDDASDTASALSIGSAKNRPASPLDRATPQPGLVGNQVGPPHLDPQQPTPLPEPPLSVAETAAWLGYDPVTVRKLIKDKKLEATKVGGQWRITRAAILKLLEKEIDP